MSILGIIVTIVAISILLLVLGNYIYRRKKNMVVGECACCASKGKKLVKDYHKKYSK